MLRWEFRCMIRSDCSIVNLSLPSASMSVVAHDISNSFYLKITNRHCRKSFQSPPIHPAASHQLHCAQVKAKVTAKNGDE